MNAKRAQIEQPKFAQKNGTRLFFKVFSTGLLLAHSANRSTRRISPLSLPASLSSPHPLAVDFVRVPQQQVPGKGTRCAAPSSRATPPPCARPRSTKKSPSLLSKKKTRGKIVLSKRERNTQCKIKKNSSFIKSSDEMAGLSTPLLRASVRRICAMISITFLPV